MPRKISFLLFLTSTLFLLQIAKAVQNTCEVSYTSASHAPKCYTYVDEFANLTQTCAEEASAAGHLLDADENSLSEDDFELEKLEFSGNCDCKVRIQSGKYLGGCYVETMTPLEMNSEIKVSQIWKRAKKPQSFSVVCEF